jgi:hypothetical protein
VGKNLKRGLRKKRKKRKEKTQKKKGGNRIDNFDNWKLCVATF